MKRSGKIILSLLGVAVLAMAFSLAVPRTVHAVVAALVEVANTTANPVPVQPVKQSTANYVTLVWLTTPAPPAFWEIGPGPLTSSVFSLGAGQQLVVTDVSWIAICLSLCTPGASAFLELDARYVSVAPFDSIGQYASHSDHYTSGLVLSGLPSGLPSPFLLTTGAGSPTLVSMIVHGYVVP
jgi:hypothetical protein